jgi:hypothetical protein
MIKTANEAFENYLKHLGEKRFDEAAGALETLKETPGQLSRQFGKGD